MYFGICCGPGPTYTQHKVWRLRLFCHFIRHVNLGKLFNLSKPQFPHLQNGNTFVIISNTFGVLYVPGTVLSAYVYTKS